MIDTVKDDYFKILTSSTAKSLFGHGEGKPPLDCELGWWPVITHNIIGSLRYRDQKINDAQREAIFQVGVTALDAFLQCSVTGPPLPWDSADVLFPIQISKDPKSLQKFRYVIISELTVEGEAVYKLIPNVELFHLAKCILTNGNIFKPNAPPRFRWARVAVNFWHQRLLSENVAQLQGTIYKDLDVLEEDLHRLDSRHKALRLVQRATIHSQYGFDKKARDDLLLATKKIGFEFKLTGRLGKRTKFQERDLSQLVVLARSADVAAKDAVSQSTGNHNGSKVQPEGTVNDPLKPQNLDLNDETLLESINFSKPTSEPSTDQETDISPSLAALDPSNQPLLQPLDSIILLAYASSITNTSPSDGLTREETLPYALRVLQQGSSNWQIYTQALLVRSRIEAYKSRTVERSVLQLQAVVDQVVVETTSSHDKTQVDGEDQDSGPSSFLPRPKPFESAPAFERLRYIHQLASPTRWELEAELANRWVSLGGLRTALEIYERLQMWAEVALCWAANEREDKAIRIIRQQLYTSETTFKEPFPPKLSVHDDDLSLADLTVEYYPPPADAPRLYCILGDLEKSPSAYEKAWEVSQGRYARAQRSLGKYYFTQGNLHKADEAYAKSLNINALNHSTWFSLGCVRLQLEDWAGAVDAFSRAIKIEDSDAESWSNLAAALLQLPTEDPSVINGAGTAATNSKTTDTDDEDLSSANTPAPDPQKHIKEAFTALKRAATLKRDSHLIWQNLLNVSVKLSPPPYTDIIVAQTRLIDLRSKSEGEKCVDVEVVEGLLAHLVAVYPAHSHHHDPLPTDTATATTNTANNESSEGRKPGFERMLVDLIRKKIIPLITSSRRLWLLVAKLDLYLQHPLATLEAYEKAWRVTLNQPGWELGTKDSEGLWTEVVDATGDLVDAYESLGERVREKGMGEGEVVARDWRFKARNAVRGVLGRGKEGWEGSELFERLRGRLEELKRG
ncbi:MAG: hypothetical protein Q9219_007512 [cf. Caloplaca sp. 3 TL-2023]